MINKRAFESHLSFLGKELLERIVEISIIKEIPKNTEFLKDGQYVNYVPIVEKGLVKVFTRHEDKDLLLYYIQPYESCVMSFSACLNRDKSKILAKTEEDSIIMLIPASEILTLVKSHPKINDLFYQQYNLRYNDLLETINHLIFDTLDKRLYDYLKEREQVLSTNQLKISHKEIAHDLGTAREVITRLLKKLEKEGKVKVENDFLKIF